MSEYTEYQSPVSRITAKGNYVLSRASYIDADGGGRAVILHTTANMRTEKGRPVLAMLPDEALGLAAELISQASLCIEGTPTPDVKVQARRWWEWWK